MGKTLNLYKTFDDLSRIDDNFSLQYNYYYKNEYLVKIPLSHPNGGENNSEIALKSEDDEWYFEKYGLCVSINIKLKNINNLYEGSNQICAPGAKISIASIYYSTESKSKNISNSVELDPLNDVGEYSIDLVLNKNDYRKTINLLTILFISKSAKVINSDDFANTVGYNLGKIGFKTIRISGDSSQFEIRTIENPNKPLWDLVFSFDNPNIDQFGECVLLVMNRAHDDYKFLDEKSEFFSRSYMDRIVQNLLYRLFLKLKYGLGDNYLLKSNLDDASDGSVTQAVKYIIETYDIDISDDEKIFKGLDKVFENKKRSE